MDRTKIIQNLKLLGFREEETKIYLETLQRGFLSITQISKLTKIPKTNVYRHVENMLSKNLVEKAIGPRGILIRSNAPSNLNFLLKEKEEIFEKIEKAFPLLIESLESLQARPKGRTQVRFYEGRKGLKQLLWNTLKAAGKSEVVGYGCLDWNKYAGERFAEKLRQEYVNRKIYNKEILNELTTRETFTKNISYIQKYYRAKFLSKSELEINYNTIIYSDFLSFYSIYKDEIFGIEIKNAEIAKNQRQIFYILWKIAQPPS